MKAYLVLTLAVFALSLKFKHKQDDYEDDCQWAFESAESQAFWTYQLLDQNRWWSSCWIDYDESNVCAYGGYFIYKSFSGEPDLNFDVSINCHNDPDWID